MMFQLLKLLKIYGEKNEEGELMTTELPTMVTEHLSKVDWLVGLSWIGWIGLSWIGLSWIGWIGLSWIGWSSKQRRQEINSERVKEYPDLIFSMQEKLSYFHVNIFQNPKNDIQTKTFTFGG